MLKELKDYCVGMTGSAAFHDAMIVVPFAQPRALLADEALRMDAVDRVY